MSSYQLTPSEFERWRRIDEQLVPRIVIVLLGAASVVGGVAGFTAGGIVTPVAVFMSAVMGFTHTFFPVMIAYAVWQPLLGVFVPSFARYRVFSKAQAAYSAWKTRTLMEFWRGLSGKAFERELAGLFGRKGYSVELTPASGDRGIAIILHRGARKTIVQCKATSKPVGPAVARELYGTLVACGADDAILAATGGVTRATRTFVKGKPIRVMTIGEIVAWHAGEPD